MTPEAMTWAWIVASYVVGIFPAALLAAERPWQIEHPSEPQMFGAVIWLFSPVFVPLLLVVGTAAGVLWLIGSALRVAGEKLNGAERANA